MKVLLKKGETLFDALEKQNIRLIFSCGGKGICGGCRVEVEKFGKVKACQFLEKEGWDDCPVIAVDLGTTTVAMAGFYRGRQITSSFTNPQRQYGADVMSRILQANSGMLEELSKAIRLELGSKLQDMAEELEKACQKVKVVVAGNTTRTGMEIPVFIRSLRYPEFLHLSEQIL